MLGGSSTDALELHGGAPVTLAGARCSEQTARRRGLLWHPLDLSSRDTL
jgi:hypothetical protein